MKGQAVNVDWVVGLSIFLVAVVAATINVVESSDITIDDGLNTKAENTADSIKSDLTTKAYLTPLYVRQPHDTGKIPYETSYYFNNTESAYLNTASRAEIAKDHIIAVLDSGNNSYRLAQFGKDVSHSFNNDISGGDTLENSYVSVKPKSGGLESIELEGEEFLENRLDLGETGEKIETFGIYGSAYSRVNVYNGSREIVFENVDTTFHFKNFSELYWEADGSTSTLSGEKTFKDGETEGIVLSGLEGKEYTATFTGDLDARVYQDSDPGTKVEINSSEAHLMLKDSKIEFGKKRVENHVSGEIYFGAEDSITVATEASVEDLRDLNRFRFDRKYDLRSFGYNTTGILERGNPVPLKPVALESRIVPKSRWNGSLTWPQLKVSIWQ